MATVTVTKGLIGVQDVNFMEGGDTTGETFDRTTSTGGTQSINKISAKAVPVEDTDSIFDGTDVESVLAEIKRGVQVPGAVSQRSLFTCTSDTILTIGAGVYHHEGTTEQLVYWDSAIAFTLGSGGSNAASEDLGADEWHYIYLDDSAIVTQDAPLLDADCFLNNTTAPTWSASKHGWYNGSDRCIFAIYSDADSDQLEFFHDGGDYVVYSDYITDQAATDIDTTWTDVTLTLPGFSIKGMVTVRADLGDGAAAIYWRTNGQNGTTGHYITHVHSPSVGLAINTQIVLTDSSQKIEIKHSLSNTTTSTVYTNGFFLPTGM